MRSTSRGSTRPLTAIAASISCGPSSTRPWRRTPCRCTRPTTRSRSWSPPPGEITDVRIKGTLQHRNPAEFAREIQAVVTAAAEAARWAREKLHGEVFGRRIRWERTEMDHLADRLDQAADTLSTIDRRLPTLAIDARRVRRRRRRAARPPRSRSARRTGRPCSTRAPARRPALAARLAEAAGAVRTTARHYAETDDGGRPPTGRGRCDGPARRGAGRRRRRCCGGSTTCSRRPGRRRGTRSGASCDAYACCPAPPHTPSPHFARPPSTKRFRSCGRKPAPASRPPPTCPRPATGPARRPTPTTRRASGRPPS